MKIKTIEKNPFTRRVVKKTLNKMIKEGTAKKRDEKYFPTSKLLLEEMRGLMPKDVFSVFYENRERMTKNMLSFLRGYSRIVTKHKGLDGWDKFENIEESVLSVDNNLLRSAYLMLCVLLDKEKGGNERRMIKNNLYTLFESSRIFHCSEKVTEMLMKTKNKLYSRRLPFHSIFIDTEITIDNIKFFGLMVTTAYNEMDGKHISFDSEEEHDCLHIFTIGKEDEKMILYNYSTLDKTGWFDKGTEYLPPKLIKQITTFACNFIDFLSDPRIQYVKATEAVIGSHERLRHLYTMKDIDLEKTYFVKISNPLQRYIDQTLRMKTMEGYSHSFWVRGHFRAFHSERYGDRVGTRIWIEPFIKGQGVLIEKHYDVERGKLLPKKREVKVENEN